MVDASVLINRSGPKVCAAEVCGKYEFRFFRLRMGHANCANESRQVLTAPVPRHIQTNGSDQDRSLDDVLHIRLYVLQ